MHWSSPLWSPRGDEPLGWQSRVAKQKYDIVRQRPSFKRQNQGTLLLATLSPGSAVGHMTDLAGSLFSERLINVGPSAANTTCAPVLDQIPTPSPSRSPSPFPPPSDGLAVFVQKAQARESEQRD